MLKLLLFAMVFGLGFYWARQRQRQRTVELFCPHCYGRMDARATVCPHCRKDILPEAPAGRGRLERNDDGQPPKVIDID